MTFPAKPLAAISISALLGALVCPSAIAQPSPASTTAANPSPSEPTKTAVTADGLVGDLYVPAGAQKRRPAILVLGGSEGGLKGSTFEARDLARRGYVALAVAYFGAPGVPDELTNIPLEYFRSAVAYLKSRPDVDARRIGLMGTSKGGEAALLLASQNPDIRAVVAGVPSSVVWQGFNRKNPMDRSGSWTQGGKPVAFLPYDVSAPFTSVHDLYERSLRNQGAHQDAIIPVERINGPVMLVCGEADALWPSCPMSGAVEARLRDRHFAHRLEKLSYPDAGHAAFGLPIPAGNPARAMLLALGGSEDGNVRARDESWSKAAEFLDRALKN